MVRLSSHILQTPRVPVSPAEPISFSWGASLSLLWSQSPFSLLSSGASLSSVSLSSWQLERVSLPQNPVSFPLQLGASAPAFKLPSSFKPVCRLFIHLFATCTSCLFPSHFVFLAYFDYLFATCTSGFFILSLSFAILL